MVVQISKKRLFVKNGLLYSELHQFFKQELMDCGYVGLEVRPRGTNTDLVLMVIKPNDVVGDKGRRIRELQTLVQRKFNYEPEKIKIYVDPVKIRGLSAVGQCENLKIRLSQGTAVRKACYSVVRYIMRSGASGCEVVVSGKIRGQRAKSMKFVEGVMIHAGDAVKDNVDFAKNSVLLKQGVLGVKVKINKTPKKKDDDPTRAPVLPDQIVVKEPEKQKEINAPYVEVHEENSKSPQQGNAPKQVDYGLDNSRPFRRTEFRGGDQYGSGNHFGGSNRFGGPQNQFGGSDRAERPNRFYGSNNRYGAQNQVPSSDLQ